MWQARVVLAIVFIPSFITALFSSGKHGNSQEVVAAVEAAHLISYSSLATDPVQSNSPGPQAFAGHADGFIDSKVAEIIDAAVDRTLEKAGMSWEELRRTGDNLSKINALFATKAEPPSVCMVLVTWKEGCPNCERVKNCFPSLERSGWKIANYSIRGPRPQIAVMEAKDYDVASDPWEIADDGLMVPKLVILRGDSVLDRGRIRGSNGRYEIVTESSPDGKNVRLLSAIELGNWINLHKKGD